jgi:hypothetical protein
MNQSQLFLFVGLIFTFVIGGFLFTQKRSSNYHEKIIHLDLNKIISIKFYQDSLRDSRDLDIPITDKKDQENFLAALKTLTPSHWAIRSLHNKIRTQMRFEFNDEEKQLFTIEIYRSEQTGDTGIVSISKEGSIFTSPGGVYESKQLLQWVEELSKRKGFENISITY